MRQPLLLAALAIAVATPASEVRGGPVTGVPTETQERLLSERNPHLPYNLIGLLGLLGLLGLRTGHDEDGYHPAPLD